jgi:hypothetical protein
LRNLLPAAYGFQLFGKSHGFSLRETRIVINQETDVAKRGAIPPPNLQYRGTAKTAKNHRARQDTRKDSVLVDVRQSALNIIVKTKMVVMAVLVSAAAMSANAGVRFGLATYQD